LWRDGLDQRDRRAQVDRDDLESILRRKGVMRVAIQRARVVDEHGDLAQPSDERGDVVEVLQVERDALRRIRQVASGEILVQRDDAKAGAQEKLRRGKTDAAAGSRYKDAASQRGPAW